MRKLNEYSTVSDTYDNVDFKDGVVGNSKPSKDGINPALLQDVQTAAKNAGLKVDITTAVSGHHPGTRHEKGNAVDIAIINGKAVSTSNRADADKLVGELIKMGYTKNKEVGNPKSVLTFGFPKHDNHVHISNTTGTPTSVEDTKLGQSTDNYETETTPNTSKSTTPSNTTQTNNSGFSDPLLMNIIGNLGLFKGLSEIKNDLIKKYPLLIEGNVYGNFGKSYSLNGKSLIIPKNSNTTIKSAVDGEITSFKYNSYCNNQITIKHKINKDTYYLEYCGIDDVKTTRYSSVSKGDKIGETKSDVIVNLYDSSGEQKYIADFLMISADKDKSNDKSNDKKEQDISKPTYKDPLLMSLLSLPARLIKSPEFRSPTKKVNEDIERIKKLL
jgi:hypothetical protein